MKPSQPPYDSVLSFPRVEDFTLSEESTREWHESAEALSADYKGARKGKTITAKLVCRDKEILFNEAYFVNFSKQYKSLQADLRKILRVFELTYRGR